MTHAWLNILNIGALAISCVGQTRRANNGHWSVRFAYWYLVPPFFFFLLLFITVQRFAGHSIRTIIHQSIRAIDSWGMNEIILINILCFITYQAIIYFLI